MRVFPDGINLRSGILRLSGRALPDQAPAGAVDLVNETTRGLCYSRNGRPFESIAPEPSVEIDYLQHFLGMERFREIDIPLFSSAGDVNLVTTTVADVISGVVRIGRAGQLAGVSLLGGTTLATSDTNYLTFALTNKNLNGAGTTAMLVATAAVTTKATGGSAWTAFTTKSLSLAASGLDLAVAAGDCLQLTATVTGTLANTVARPMVRFQFIEVPDDIHPRPALLSGSPGPLLIPNTGTANGEAIVQLGSGSGAMGGRYDWNGEQFVNASLKPVFTCRLKVSAATANQAWAWGLASANTGVWDTHTHNAWFRVEGASLALLAETDDNTTDRDDQATGITLTANTYATFKIDMTDLSAVKFLVDLEAGAGFQQVQSLSMSALPANTLLQPVVGIYRPTGTVTDMMTIDYLRVRGRVLA